MNVCVLDRSFNIIDILEKFESLIWTMRFQEAGDFEIVLPIDLEALKTLSVGNYIFCDRFYNSEQDKASIMIIETLELIGESDSKKIKISGRDLKSILDRRIIWAQKSFSVGDNIFNAILEMIDENVTNPPTWTVTYQDSIKGDITITVNSGSRYIPNFECLESIGAETFIADVQYKGDNLYEVITNLCSDYGFGWDVLYNFATGKMQLGLKSRTDKSWGQDRNTPLLFSPKFDNLKSSNYIESSVNEKTAGLIIGEGDEYNVMYNAIDVDSTLIGLDRKEMTISASDISRKDDSGNEYGNNSYLQMLYSRGSAELKENKYTKVYEGTVNTILGYEYLKDYNIGDICEIVNEYGIESKVLIDEIVLSVNANEINIIPSFMSI